jgi:threonine dehydratase
LTYDHEILSRRASSHLIFSAKDREILPQDVPEKDKEKEEETMAALSTCPPLTRSSVQAAHLRISKHIHKTPIVTCQTLNQVASTPISSRSAEFTPRASSSSIEHDIRPKVTLEESTANPQINIFFKCENQQRIGAFKVRGAFHALGRLIEMEGLEAVRRKGVVTHSSGKIFDRHSLHAWAIAFAFCSC